MMKLFRWLLPLIVAASPAFAQSQTVRQSGTVTNKRVSCWSTTGVIQDCGTAASGFPSSFGTTGQGPTICANSDLITAAGGYQQICIGTTTQGGGVISTQNLGGATAQPLTFQVNGSSVVLPATPGTTFITGTAPFTANGSACFSGSAGAISNCAYGAWTLFGNPTSSFAIPQAFSIGALPFNGTPAGNTDRIMGQKATDGSLYYTTPSAIAGTNIAGVSSIGGLSGAVSLGYGLTTASGTTVLVDTAAVRVKQTGGVTLYVRTDGSDSNTCLVNNAGGACLTIQGAWNKLQNNYDLAGFGCTVNVADGTYTAIFNPTAMPVGSGTSGCQIIGNTSTPGNVIISVTGNNAVQCGDSTGGYAIFLIDGFELRTISSGNTLEVNANCFVKIGANMRFGASAGIHIYGHTGGRVVETPPGYSIVGSANTHMLAISNSAFIIHGITITCTGTPNMTFASAATGGSLLIDALTFSGCGGLTGGRFFAQAGGIIITGTNDINYLPGNTAGVVVPGGIYDSIGSTPTTANRAVGAATGLTNNVTANIVSISLDAGTWDISGNCGLTFGGSTVATQFHCGIATTTGALPVADQQTVLSGTNLAVASIPISQVAPRQFLALSTTTTVYLVVQSSFTVDTAAAYGNLIAVSHR